MYGDNDTYWRFSVLSVSKTQTERLRIRTKLSFSYMTVGI